MNPFPLIFNSKFETYPNNFKQYFGLLTILTHFILTLNWFRTNLLLTKTSSYPMENWKAVMMLYFLMTFAIAIFCMIYFNFVGEKAVYLLNSLIQLEMDCKQTGKVLNYYELREIFIQLNK